MLSKILNDNIIWIEAALQKDKSFDVKKQELIISGKNAAYFFLNGFIDTDNMIKVHQCLIKAPDTVFDSCKTMKEFSQIYVSFTDVEIVDTPQDISNQVHRGSVVLIIDGFDEALSLDVRSFPQRGVEEPEQSKTLRGPHDGFTESLISNAVQIRRRITTSQLHMEKFTLGNLTRTEVALCYLEGKADEKLVDKIRKKLENFNLNAVSMNQQVLTDYLFPQRGLSLLNPFPRVRYIERPDITTAMLLEGKIIIICDGTPSVLAIPVNIFDFFEGTDDYYFPPITGSYLRIIRFLIFMASVFLVPSWLLAANNRDILPSYMNFILIEETFAVPLYLQLLIIEFAIDGLKMASLNSPDTLSNSLSIIGGLLLGDFAVQSKWFVPQTILYSSFTAIANFSPTNYELGYSFKFIRILLIILVQLFGIWGFVGGVLFSIIILINTKNAAGKDYLYPIFPFSAKALKKILFRTRKGKEV